MHNWKGVLIALAFALFMFYSAIESLRSGKATTTGKGDRKVTYYRDKNPGDFWSSVVFDIIFGFLCLGGAYILGFGSID